MSQSGPGRKSRLQNRRRERIVLPPVAAVSDRRAPLGNEFGGQRLPLQICSEIALINFSSRGRLTPPAPRIAYAPPRQRLTWLLTRPPPLVIPTAPRICTMSPRRLLAAFSRFSRPARRQDGQASQARQRRTASHSCPAPHRRAARIPLHAFRRGQAGEQHFDV